MSVCDEPRRSCDDTKLAVIGWDISHTTAHTKDRKSVFVLGGNEIVLNQRTRNYQYEKVVTGRRNNFQYVISANTYFECFDLDETDIASVSDRYETIDSEIKYLDLRYDIAVYEQTELSMEYAEADNDVLVNIRTSYDDSHSHPFMWEDVPITGTRKLIFHQAGTETVLNQEAINSGYWNGIRILLPLFGAGTAPYGLFTYHGVEYNAGEVDWYYLPNHMEADGGVDLFYPDWLRAVGIYNELDQREADMRWAITIGAINPMTTLSDDELHTSDTFDGSVAVDRERRIFYSIADGDKVFNFLTSGVLPDLIPNYASTWKLYPTGLA